MSRAPRSDAAGIYHITSRGNRSERTFRCDGDYARFLGRFADVAGRHRLVCRAFCLMPNHFHLELDVPEGELSRAMHRLNSGYAHWFNRKYDFVGHVFQGRFHSEYVDAEQHQLELSRYLPLNPVRAGLAPHPAEWPWSSYKATVGHVPAPPFLDVKPVLERFGSNVERARERFAVFVAEGATTVESSASMLDALSHVPVTGTGTWLKGPVRWPEPPRRRRGRSSRPGGR